MSLDILLSEMNEGEIETLAAELVARLSGEQFAARSEPEISASDFPSLIREVPKDEVEAVGSKSQSTAETPPEAQAERRKASPALEMILGALRGRDAELVSDSMPALSESVVDSDFSESQGRQGGFLDEPQYVQQFSDTSRPTEAALSKVPYNSNPAVSESDDYGDKTESAFSPRGDTVPAFRSGMERVSDFFMRDSRRYDSGFERF